MQHFNSVLDLRQRELALSTRTMKARGSKVIRCEQCLIPATHCICEHKPQPVGGVAFCFIMYKGECYKPSNTGRLIADVIEDNHAFLWHRVDPDPAMLALLKNPDYSPILVFPHQYAEAKRCISTTQDIANVSVGKKPLFVMLDGTWREALKMFRSAYLFDIPVLGIQPKQSSRYQLREAAHEHQLCTAEVAIEVLTLAEEQQAANALTAYFDIFRKAYVAGKPHITLIER